MVVCFSCIPIGIAVLLLKHGARCGDAMLRAVDVGFLETVKKITEFANSLEVTNKEWATPFEFHTPSVEDYIRNIS